MKGCEGKLMRWSSILAVAIPAAFLGAGSAGAAIIYDNGGPNQVQFYFGDSNYPYTQAAETFTLSAGANTIGDVHWWGACQSGSLTCPTGAFTLNFYSDSSGLPGSLLSSYDVGNANQTLTGNAISFYSEYAYSTNIPALTLAAGTTFWLGISNSTTGELAWGWETTGTVHDGTHAQFCNNGISIPCGSAGWQTQPDDLAFNLTNGEVSAVPEPGSLALLGSGLIAFGCARRRKRKPA
jgi:hypothetical protein